MSKPRKCGHVVMNRAFKEAAKAANMEWEPFYDSVKTHVLNVDFPSLKKHHIGSGVSARAGQWERWTNGQDPIWKSYRETVTWKGTAQELLQELAL